MSADDLDSPKWAGHEMHLLEIENLHVEIDGKKILKVGEVPTIMSPNGLG